MSSILGKNKLMEKAAVRKMVWPSEDEEDEDEDEEDEEEEVDDTIEGSNGDSPLLDRRPSVSASVTGVSTETVNGRFV